MMRDEVPAIFLEEYAKETARLEAIATDSQPQRDLELVEIDRQIALVKAAILKGVDPSMFVAEMKQWAERRQTLLAEAANTLSARIQTMVQQAAAFKFDRRTRDVKVAFDRRGRGDGGGGGRTEGSPADRRVSRARVPA